MRWFKHMTDMKDDPKVNLLFESHGHRGVLIYVWLLEIIAKNMDETDLCSLKTTRQHWAKMLRTYWHHVEKILTSCRDHGLIILTSTPDHVDISCPKLLIIRARKKPIGGTKIPLDIDIDIEVDSRRRSPISPKGELTGIEFFETFWKETPKKRDKQGCLRIWKKKNLDLKIDLILTNLRIHKESSQWTRDAGQYIPNPSTWLNQERWDESIQVIKEKTWEDRFDEKLKLKGML